MYLLDSDVIVELRKAGSEKANENVVKWANSVPTAGTFLSAITILELEIAILEFEWQDEERGAIMRKWLDDHVIPAFDGRVLPINEKVARKCAQFHSRGSHSEGATLLAATALVHGLTVVTRNIDEFKPTGVTLCNPWDAPENAPCNPNSEG
ncbi:type II toxin-antitoxin system VapC family toxin [uncultured Thalassospira sp.]|jgi:predicted nucleic acid-binding protein|uniref:type II toxin-antitoxin system VapC family toxin n=1 Tax=uncultured Thalassospira sp. TaxID=404382 RepID=UPI0030D9065B|tara:strand:- start:7461 stop:7916 length:456 start_codon:yes stop_codon:yes gene_type:complete